MSLSLLSSVFGKRGITHKQSKVDCNFVQVYELIDGRSVPVLQVNLVDGRFLEMPHFEGLTDRSILRMAEAQEEFQLKFKPRNKKSH